MIAIRFHGRGGQGAKTASRIVGTAAFLEGYQAQDSPLYGPERRGAPVSAFTRIGREPIRERGYVAHPDLVVIADASLIRDQAARVEDGVGERTAVFVNSPRSGEQVAAETSLQGRIVTWDLTEAALRELGKRDVLSALLGAAACRLAGLKRESTGEAVARELSELGLSQSVLDRNHDAALRCYDALPAVDLADGAKPRVSVNLRPPSYEPPTRGTARITASANSVLRETGGWRTFRPVLSPDRCNGCWLCFVYCPDGVITMNEQDQPVIDYAHCKGCQICVQECPTHALAAEREEEGHRAWTAR